METLGSRPECPCSTDCIVLEHPHVNCSNAQMKLEPQYFQ